MPQQQPGMPPPTPPLPGLPGAAAAVPVQLPKFHDVTVVTKKTIQKACVVGVPPEEFGISRFARSIKDAGYLFHEVLRREEDLIAEGYDPDQIKAIPTYSMLTNPEELARDTVDEHLSSGGDEGINEANRQIKITEHYVRMDYEGNGKPALYMVTTGGDQGDVLDKDGKPCIEQVDDAPFAAMTPVIVTHRFFGRSIADLVMDIQRIKTALLRSILDNAYLAVNPRPEVFESGATDTTIDDLLVSAPGRMIRTKGPNSSVVWQEVPNIAAGIFPLMEYVDGTREARTGVSKVSQGLDANALQNQSATAAAQVYSAAQARMKLIARIFAETGIKDLFNLLHGTIRRNGSQQQTIQLRQQWVTVDPRDWKKRDSMTINVGLGSGGRAQQVQELMVLINAQKDALAGGLTNLVTPANLYNASQELAKAIGRKDGDQFFSDPATQPAPQAPPDPKMMQIQGQLELQQAKQQTDAAHQTAKAQSDMAIQQQKAELQMRQMLFEAHAEMQKHTQTIHQNNQEHAMSMAKMAAELHAKQQEQAAPKASVEVKHNSKDIAGPISEVVAQLGQHLANHSTAQTQAILGAIQHLAAPKRVVRDAQGRVSHVESVQ